MENNQKNDSRDQLKKQIKFIRLTNIIIFITLGVIVYELYNKLPHFYSFLLLGVVFIMMGFNQFIHYKRLNKKKNIILFVLYLLLGIMLIVYRLISK